MARRQFSVDGRASPPPLLYKPQKVSNLRTALFIQREPWRLNTAVLLSLLIHALLLSMALGGRTFGLPGLHFPWKEVRPEASDLRILLAPAPAAAPTPADTSPTEMASATLPPMDQPAVTSNTTSMTMPSSSIAHREAAAVSMPPPTSIPAPATEPAPPVMAAPERPDVNLPIAPDAPRVRSPATPVARNTPTQGNDLPVPDNAADAMQKQVDQKAQEQALERERSERLRQAELTANAQREATRQEQLRQDAARAEEAAKSEAARMVVERQELARQEGLRREAQQKERAKQDEKAQQDAARQELERAEAARQEAGRKEAARQEQTRLAQLEAVRQDALKQEAARREAAKQEAARQEQVRQAQLDAARQDALKQETTRREAAKQEAARQAQLDTARQDALKQEAARRDAAKQEAARQDAIAQEAARQAAAKQEAARQEQAKLDQAQRERAEQEAKRDERLRAIGKQLDQEAAQRDAASNHPSRSLLPTVSSLRRGWLLGRADPNADLVQYAEAMARKIEMNMTFDMVREAVKQPHVPPMVTVAIRADGSVEKVTFVVSSGVPAIDEAIRKVVASQAPYAAFTPTLARQYDVIEIRRTWVFDSAIRLQ
jgi:hypothetical protein